MSYEVLKVLFSGLHDKYRAFDLNNDGVITIAEFRAVVEGMVGEPCPDDEWAVFINKVDYNNSGTVEFDEFLYALFLWFADDDYSSPNEAETEEKDEVDDAFQLLKTLFQRLDGNRDGAITANEFAQCLKQLVMTKHPGSAVTPTHTRATPPPTATMITTTSASSTSSASALAASSSSTTSTNPDISKQRVQSLVRRAAPQQKSHTLTFKQYLYAVYLFVTE
ncbi:hypothetical protein Pelo_13992 [Pelomyxa schiedti]|nr:hypothetical protein Pelo_13992 [Pelomyxa schiedti]